MTQTRKYSTVQDEDCTNYREIAKIMTDNGYTMNHSSARNHLLRAMRKFAIAIARHHGKELDETQIWNAIKDPEFQDSIGGMIERELARQNT